MRSGRRGRVRVWAVAELAAMPACLAALALLLAGPGAAAPYPPATITTYAGYNHNVHPPVLGYTRALMADLRVPGAVACDAAGNVYVSEFQGSRVCRIYRDGNIATVAGTGQPGFTGDGGPASDAELDVPFHLAVDAAGNLYIGDTANQRIRMASPSGIITTVVGGGFLRGSDVPAVDAALVNPSQMVPLPGGGLLVADWGRGQLLRIDTLGFLTVIAGTGARTASGDGGPATQASFALLAGVAVDPEGNIYVSDAGANVVRRIDARGIITRYAGSGKRGFSGDGGPALDAQFDFPWGLGYSAGELYIVDGNNQRIRKVRRDGTIMTVAGNGDHQSDGDGGPANRAGIMCPATVAFDPNGDLYVNDAAGTVRKVTFPPLQPGDVDGDGTAGAADVTLALRFALRLEAPTGRQLAAVGADPKQGVRLADVIRLLRQVLGVR